ncbi:unnamed protein product [Adineta ricciae]|uniref:Uncharacterized protein n=1 Tax=Adineta ricciae TaxID=249248 RepID=A0A815RII7_ADIRI|nr:unnamed protein product [Adineta ricciae]
MLETGAAVFRQTHSRNWVISFSERTTFEVLAVPTHLTFDCGEVVFFRIRNVAQIDLTNFYTRRNSSNVLRRYM